MTATPEQIAERLVTLVEAHFIGANERAARDAAALIRAQAERVRVLEAKLEKIAGEAPAKEPRDQPTVGWPPSWSTNYRDEVNDMVQDAFNEGHARACWELGQIADAALKAAP